MSAAAVVPIRRDRANRESVAWPPLNPVEVADLRVIMRYTPRRRRVAVAIARLGREQRALAAVTQTSQMAVSKWVRGELPKLLGCEAIADACGLTLTEMWGD